MFSVKSGKPIAAIRGGTRGDGVLGVTENGDVEALGRDIELRKGRFEPILELEGRCIDYTAGPSGAGKSTYVGGLIKRHRKLHPDARVIVYSRGKIDEDPAFKEIEGGVEQAELGAHLVEAPLDITGLEKGTILVFDDVGTILDDKVKEAVHKIIMDCAEVGRKQGIYLIVTSHLVNPNDRKFGRVMLNEMQFLTLFPGGGNAHSVRYVLRQYLGLDSKQIQRILDSKSRWVRIHVHSPRWVLEETAAYII